LTASVLEVLQRRRFGADERYVFSNHRHTCVSARAKIAASTLSTGLSFEFRAHDLRRTAASFMGEAGVDRFHIAHVLNHRSVTHSTVTAIYDRYRYDKEKRLALEAWEKALKNILNSEDPMHAKMASADARAWAAASDLNNRHVASRGVS
jgi:integrase